MCRFHFQNHFFILSLSLISLLFEGCSTCELNLQNQNLDTQETCEAKFKLQLLDFSLDLGLEMDLNVLTQDQNLIYLQSSHLDLDILVLNQQNRLIINEVLINPIGSDSQKEWLEIINPNQQAIDLKGMSLFYQNQLIMECEAGVLTGQSFFVIYSNDQTISSALDSELILNAKDQGIRCTTQNFKFNNDHDFTFEIANRNGLSIDRFEGLGIEIKNGISLTRLKGGTSSMIIAHDQLSDLLEISPPRMHSPHQDLTFAPFSKNTQFSDPEILNCRMPQKKQMLINEIMVKPQKNALEDQWIELLNTTPYPLSLQDISLSFHLKNPNQSDQINDVLYALPKICIAAKSTCYLWPHPKNLGLLCASDFSFYPLEGLGLDLSAFEMVEMSLKRNQVLIDFISFQSERIQDGISFNRLVDGSDGPLILHSELEPHLDSSFLRCANGNQWAENCQPKLSLKDH